MRYVGPKHGGQERQLHSIDHLSGKANVGLARETAAVQSDHPASKALLERAHDHAPGSIQLPRLLVSPATRGELVGPSALLMAETSDIVAGAHEARV